MGKYGKHAVMIDGQLYGSISATDETGKKRQIRQKVDTPRQAYDWAILEKSKIRVNGGVLKIEKKTTFAELADWYAEHHLIEAVIENGSKVDGVKDHKALRAKLERIKEYFGHKELAKITESDLVTFARVRRQRDKVVTATINRDYALMRAAFIAGKGLHRLLEIPKFPINEEAEVKRDRVLSLEEEVLLLAACVDGKEIITVERKGKTFTQEIEAKRGHLKGIIIVAVETAMRKGEMFKITWKEVSLEKGEIFIPKAISKTNKDRTVPITPLARAVLEAFPHRKGKVFEGNYCKRAWRSACKRAGLVDDDAIRFHDLRHTATTRMVRAGVPHTEVMKITGHSQMKTFLRYVNLTSPAIQSAAQMLARFRAEQEVKSPVAAEAMIGESSAAVN